MVGVGEARSTETMFYERAERPLDARAARDAEKLIRVTSQLLGPAATTLFDAWCIADVDLSIALQRMILNGDPVPDAVGAYARAQWQRRSVRDFLEMKRPSDS